MTSAPLERAGRRRLAVALVAAVALAWFAPTLVHGLRSDEYQLPWLFDRESGAVDWPRALAQFWQPWIDVPYLYRPLISLSVAGQQVLGGQAWQLHLLNVVSLAVTAACVAATAARLACSRPAAAAIVAGMTMVLHPATVEPTAWILARTTGLQVMFGALAAWLFVRRLGGHGSGRIWPEVLAGALALCSKEGAVTLPLSFLAIDLLHEPRRSLRRRVAVNLPIATLVLAYLVLRLVALGAIGSPDDDVSLPDRLHNLWVRTGNLLLPGDADAVRSLGPVSFVLLLPALLVGLRWRAVVLLPWLALLLLPTSHMRALPGVLYGRLVFDALPVLAIAAALAVDRAGSRRWTNPWTTGGAVLWLATLAPISRHWLTRYDEEDQIGRATAAAVVTAGQSATMERPFACTGLPELPVFHRKLWGVLGMAPYAPRDLPVIGLPELLHADSEAPATFGDAAPLHAVLDADGVAASWHTEQRRFLTVERPSLPPATLLPTAVAGEFSPPAPWPGTAVQRLAVQVPATTRKVRLQLLDDLPAERAFGWRETDVVAGPTGGTTGGPTSGTAWFDLSHAFAPMLLQGFGLPFRGVRLELDGAPAPATTRVELYADMPRREAPASRGDHNCGWDEFPAVLHPPIANAAARLYLLLPTGARSAPFDPTASATLPPELAEHLRFARRYYRTMHVWWFWQGTDEHGAPWRSPLDWAQLR